MRKLLFSIVALLCAVSASAQRYDNYLPEVTNVSLSETNLPIIFITVNKAVIQRRNTIQGQMKIVDNGSGNLNYGDLTTHSSQNFNYNGAIAIKYRGNSSFVSSDKKPYAIYPTDASGNVQKVSLLGMTTSSEWALLAPFSDRSLIRNVLSFNLARQFMPKIPQAKFCEVVVDGVYYGIYLLTERVSSLMASDAELFEVDRADETNLYTSSYKPYSTAGSAINYAKVTYQPKTANAISTDITAMEQSLAGSSYATQIDATSFADYLLNTEFAHNADGYRLSTNLYKESGGKFKTSLWDMDLGFGNYDAFEGYRNDTWVYNENDILSAQDDPQLVPFYWYNLIHNADFQSTLKARWQEYRKDVFTQTKIDAKIDSLTTLLNANGALTRNFTAWPIWSKKVWPNYKVTASYDAEITYLKEWIGDRLTWMDTNIGNEDVIEPVTPGETKVAMTTPISITSGFNTDCVAEATSTAPTDKDTHPALDGHGSVFATVAVASSGNVLPDNGAITGSNGHTFQLASYTANNCLYLPKTSSSGTLTFASPVTTDSLSILLCGANKDNYDLAYDIQVNYSDGTYDTVNMTEVLDDWCYNRYGTQILSNLRRWRADNDGVDGTLVSLSENKIKVNKAKAVKSLTFTSQCQSDSWGYGMIGVFAVSSLKWVTTGVETIQTPTTREIKSIYSMDGQQLNHLQKGINILRYSDGTTKKVVVK
ncbi:MAG: CotH kinase family protein [Prevotella sp.]|jgi:hypothetical protein|nr:CotH kinase family protein [Prevotella sp.]MCI1282104.1 CotH kinase family protein [Prevotella sp.]